ncbi:DNA polymerase IV [Sphingobacterium sp. 1.A.4]|uniref:DNA polymerase IV n=1 Tax=Sphingobacterium sp. 1.A.4 TaxID=2044603 RepID=UPI000C0C004A|nr:DNA polymerase IV [Sphingobacterium sp. 1.A.4]
MRKIIHIDMDAFYASVEQRDFPEFRGKPLAVGGSPDGRGVVATASYEARKFGVKSAMSSRMALQLCPDLLFTYPRFDVYKQVSNHIRSIFLRYTDIIEPLSLDEAFLDVTEDKLGIGSALDIAREIKEAIREELQLTASAGVSVNKFVAKIASDLQKPDGLTFIGPSKIVKFLEQLPVDKFFGVGKVTAKKMHQLGIFTGKDLKRFSESEMIFHFGKSGKFFFHIVRGEDNRPVKPNRISKSIGAEDTFEKDLRELEDLRTEVIKLSAKVFNRLDKSGRKAKTITLKVKFADFTQITRSKTMLDYFGSQQEIEHLALELLENLDLQEIKIRLLGVTVSNFQTSEGDQLPNPQLKLF